MNDLSNKSMQSDENTEQAVVCDPIATARAKIAEIIDITAEELAEERRRQKLKEATDQERPCRRRVKTSALVFVTIIFVASVFYTGFRLYGLSSPQRLTPQEVEEYIEDCLDIVQLDIEAYKIDHGRYPPSLAEITIPLDDGINYAVDEKGNYCLSYGIGTTKKKRTPVASMPADEYPALDAH